jgi:hypothetical protein
VHRAAPCRNVPVTFTVDLMDMIALQARLRSALSAATCHGPVSDEEVAAAERQLGVRFPPGLRAFLSEHGAAVGRGMDLAGVPVRGGMPPQWSDLVSTTLRARKPTASLPSNLVFISDDGMDCRYYLDTARVDAEGECPVVALGPGRDCDVVAETFVQFVERASRGERL